MLRWLATNLRTFLLAFIMALAVWVAAVTAADPDKTHVYPGSIPIEFIGQDSSLIITGTIPKQVEVTLRAPQSVWDRLNADASTLRAVADLTGLGSGTHTIEVQVQVDARPVRIISIAPRTLELSLEPLVTRTLPVELNIINPPPTGYKVGEAVIDPAEVVFSGPESIITQVEHIQAAIDLSDARQNIKDTMILQAVDQDGISLSGITIHPENVQIDLPLIQLSGYRDLAVKVVWVGRPASGYVLTNVASSPLIVTVFSENLALIDSLPGYVETSPLNLSGASEDIETQLDLVLPAGVSVVGGQTVLVQVGIAPIKGSLTITYRTVDIVGLSSGLTAQISPRTVDVNLSGPLPVLDSLLVSDVHVRIDLTGLTPGSYQLTPTVVIAKPGVTVDSIVPGTVEVIIK